MWFILHYIWKSRGWFTKDSYICTPWAGGFARAITIKGYEVEAYVENESSFRSFLQEQFSARLGIDKIYKTANPFDFMENISLNGKTNFFERKVGEYAKANVMANVEDNDFSLDGDF